MEARWHKDWLTTVKSKTEMFENLKQLINRRIYWLYGYDNLFKN
jgi:hypothetical protein